MVWFSVVDGSNGEHMRDRNSALGDFANIEPHVGPVRLQSNMGVEHLLDFGLVYIANALVHHFSVLEQQQGRNRENLIARRNLSVVSHHLQLANLRSAGVLGSNGVDGRHQVLARFTIVGPKINQHRLIRFDNLVIASVDT
jgi:hypothetical protein